MIIGGQIDQDCGPLIYGIQVDSSGDQVGFQLCYIVQDHQLKVKGNQVGLKLLLKDLIDPGGALIGGVGFQVLLLFSCKKIRTVGEQVPVAQIQQGVIGSHMIR